MLSLAGHFQIPVSIFANCCGRLQFLDDRLVETSTRNDSARILRRATILIELDHECQNTGTLLIHLALVPQPPYLTLTSTPLRNKPLKSTYSSTLL